MRPTGTHTRFPRHRALACTCVYYSRTPGHWTVTPPCLRGFRRAIQEHKTVPDVDLTRWCVSPFSPSHRYVCLPGAGPHACTGALARRHAQAAFKFKLKLYTVTNVYSMVLGRWGQLGLRRRGPSL
jgi:hypothetical protein